MFFWEDWNIYRVFSCQDWGCIVSFFIRTCWTSSLWVSSMVLHLIGKVRCYLAPYISLELCLHDIKNREHLKVNLNNDLPLLMIKVPRECNRMDYFEVQNGRNRLWKGMKLKGKSLSFWCQAFIHSFIHSFSTWGRGRFTVVSMWNTEFILVYYLLIIVLFSIWTL